MKHTLIIAVSSLLFCGPLHSSSSPRTTPATEKIKGQLIGLAQLVDAGNTTPEAAWVSRYWARAQGDYDAVIAATEPKMVDAAKAWMGDKETFRARSQSEFESFKGIQILARKDVAADKVELKYEFAFGERRETKTVEMIKINGAWKSGQTRAHDASWDAGSQPEPQPRIWQPNKKDYRRKKNQEARKPGNDRPRCIVQSFLASCFTVCGCISTSSWAICRALSSFSYSQRRSS